MTVVLSAWLAAQVSVPTVVVVVALCTIGVGAWAALATIVARWVAAAVARSAARAMGPSRSDNETRDRAPD